LVVEYETEREGIVRPFFAAGLGMSTYTFSYYVGRSVNETSTSITISPQMGVRFFIAKNTMCYLKGSYVFVMNGLPLVSYPNLPAIIFPVSGEATGYAGIAIGFCYRYDSRWLFPSDDSSEERLASFLVKISPAGANNYPPS